MSRLFYIVLIIIILFLLKDINAQDLSIWRTSSSSAAGAYNRAVFYNQYVLDGEASDKRDGFAIRCIKD